jgi:hypothetical protein
LIHNKIAIKLFGALYFPISFKKSNYLCYTEFLLESEVIKQADTRLRLEIIANRNTSVYSANLDLVNILLGNMVPVFQHMG